MGKYVTASLAVGQDGHQVWRLATNSCPPVWGRRGPNKFTLKEINVTIKVSQSSCMWAVGYVVMKPWVA